MPSWVTLCLTRLPGRWLLRLKNDADSSMVPVTYQGGGASEISSTHSEQNTKNLITILSLFIFQSTGLYLLSDDDVIIHMTRSK